MPEFTFTVVDSKKWESLPIPTPAKPKDRYEAILDALESGEIIQLTIADQNDMKGKRIALGRKSRARGFIVEFRNEGNNLYAKRSEKPISPAEPKTPKERKKNEQVPQRV